MSLPSVSCFAQIGDDAAAPEDHDAVAQVEHLAHVVADQDQRLAIVLQGADDVFDLRRFLDPQRCRRLVHDDQLGREGRGPCDRHALPLAARHVTDGVGEVGDLDRRADQCRFGRLAHVFAVQDREGPEVEQHLLTAEEQVRRHVEVVGESQVLEHGLDARFARLDRSGEVHFLAVEPHLAAGALLDAGDLADEGRLACAVVAHDGDMFALAQLEVCALERMHAAIALGQVFGLQDGVGHGQALIARRRWRHWSRTTAPTMITPFTIS
jgi:hypothetical protein